MAYSTSAKQDPQLPDARIRVDPLAEPGERIPYCTARKLREPVRWRVTNAKGEVVLTGQQTVRPACGWGATTTNSKSPADESPRRAQTEGLHVVAACVGKLLQSNSRLLHVRNNLRRCRLCLQASSHHLDANSSGVNSSMSAICNSASGQNLPRIEALIVRGDPGTKGATSASASNRLETAIVADKWRSSDSQLAARSVKKTPSILL